MCECVGGKTVTRNESNSLDFFTAQTTDFDLRREV